MSYGKSMVIDLEGCDTGKFNREDLEHFFMLLTMCLGMERGDLCWWDDVGVPEDEKQTDPRTTGTSAVQFILTSSIVVHTLDLTGQVFIDIFTCGELDDVDVRIVVAEFFRPSIFRNCATFIRG